MAAKSKSAKYNFVYQTKNLITGKTYVGVRSTNVVEDGYIGSGIESQAHVRAYMKLGVNSHFIRAVHKYGYENFKREILAFYDTLEEAYEEEAFIVDRKWINSKDNYNVALGGYGGATNICTTLEQEQEIVSDYLNTELKVNDLLLKHKISFEVLTRIKKEYNISHRGNINRYSTQKEKLDKVKDQIIDLYLRGAKQEKLARQFKIDLLDIKFFVGINRYVAVKDENVFYFNDTKTLKLIPGFESCCMSYVKPVLDGKCTHSKGYKILRVIDHRAGVTQYKTIIPQKTKYDGVVLYKEGNAYIVTDNLRTFTKQHGLDHSATLRLINGEVKTHKGFTLTKEGKINGGKK
jgi:hypothetical protein